MQRLIIALIFILPLAFWSGIDAYSVKIGLIWIVNLLLLLGLIWRMYKKNLSISLHKSAYFLLLLPVSLALSAALSGSYEFSFFGNTVEVGTVSSFISFGFLFFFTLASFSGYLNYRAITKAYLATTSLLLLHFFSVVVMNYGWVSPVAGFPLVLAGGYEDMAILLGLGVLATIFLLNQKEQGTLRKIILWSYSVASFFVIGAVGYTDVEVALGAFLLGIYLLRKKYSKLSIVVFVACIVFAIGGAKISGPLSSLFRVSSLDARPSFLVTADIALKQWKTNFITGAGPNRFADLWSLYKPASVNTISFLNQDFFFGSSMASTLAVTGGVLTLFILFAFAFYLLRVGLKFGKAAIDPPVKTLPLVAFSATLYLWLFIFIYNPGVTVLAFAFISSGLFVCALIPTGYAHEWRPDFGIQPKRFISAIGALLLLIVFAYSSFYSVKKLYAANIFYRALTQYNSTGDLGRAEAGTLKAVSLSRSDIYFRTLVGIYSLDIENKVKNLSATTSNEILGQIQNEINFAEAAARAAIEVNPMNYANYMTEAGFYGQLALNKVGGALERSQASYTEALKRNPSNPAIYLGLSRLSVAGGDSAKAKEYAAKSISLKPNYSAAYYLLAQLEAAGNNVEGAITNVEKAALSEGNNAGLYFQLGLLKYNAKDYKGAIAALESSITIVSDYANAKYFLGLSYYYSGNREAALKQFEAILITNPDNTEVKLIIENLKAGHDPFENAKPPVDSKPLKRKTPPVND